MAEGIQVKQVGDLGFAIASPLVDQVLLVRFLPMNPLPPVTRNRLMPSPLQSG